MPRRKGFTLIELLVVIAIIGILAAMLFPVFARARESARKTQCLSNIKNIAMAVQMYLSDYDRFPPREHRADIAAYFAANPSPGGGPATCSGFPNGRIDGVNPYLRWPVLFDEYIKNRDIWRCPSARREDGPAYIEGDHWWEEMVAYQSSWGRGNGGLEIVCADNTFPPGWGGTVTDSLVQYLPASEGGTTVFVQSIGTGEGVLREKSASEIGDATNLIVCADANNTQPWAPGCIIFPDSCQVQCGSAEPGCCNSGCDDSFTCTPPKAKHEIWTGGPESASRTRHLGGSNLGFADGHAKWWAAMAIAGAVRGGENTGTWGCSYGRTCLGLPPPTPNPTLTMDVNGGNDVWTGCLCRFQS